MGQAKRFQCKQLITVEPVIFFYAYGLFMHLPVIQQYIYYRIAKSKGFPYSTAQKSNSCGNITMFNDTMKDLEKQVQSLSSYVHLGIVLFSSLPSLVISLLMGSWSDSRGRKPALFFPCLGSAIEAGITILVMYFEWPVYVLFIGGAVNGLCGYFTTIIMAVMAYIADTTDESARPVRLAVLELLTFLGGMLSQVTSGLWIEKYGFITPYWFILGCLLFSVIYTAFFVPESRPTAVEERAKFFSCKSLKRVYKVYSSPREGGRRNLFLLTISSAIMQISVQGVSAVITLFVIHTPLCFTPELVGFFAAWRSLAIGLGAIIGIKLFGKCLTELTIMRFGIITRIGSLVLLGLSSSRVLVFLVPLAGLFNGCVVPIFRGMLSRIVSSDEQGALFSAIASLETLANFIGAFIFNTLYPASLKFDFQGFVFIVGAGVTLVPFFFVMCCLKNPMSLLSKKDRVQIVGKYEAMPDDNLNSPIQGSVNANESSPISTLPPSDMPYNSTDEAPTV